MIITIDVSTVSFNVAVFTTGITFNGITISVLTVMVTRIIVYIRIGISTGIISTSLKITIIKILTIIPFLFIMINVRPTHKRTFWRLFFGFWVPLLVVYVKLYVLPTFVSSILFIR